MRSLKICQKKKGKTNKQKQKACPKLHGHAIMERTRVSFAQDQETVESCLFGDSALTAAFFSPLSAAFCKALDATDPARP